MNKEKEYIECEQCLGEGREPHTCPLKEEISLNYEKCSCCQKCEDACHDEI